MTNAVQEIQRLGQSIWYDNISRGLITSGELERLIDLGITGLTSNPTIFEKAIAGSTDYDDALLPFAAEERNAGDAFEALAIDDIRAVADLMRPIYERTDGVDGYASLEVSPHLARDTEGTIAEARRLFADLDRPNVLVKVPGTPEGIPAIRQLISEGVNVNVTLIFSLDAYRGVREAYIAGLEDLAASGGDVGGVASVASFFVSRVDTSVDKLLEAQIDEGRPELKDHLGKAAIANAKLAYQAFRETFDGERFSALRAKDARVQRPLWASTGTKNPAYSDIMYLESLVGPDTVNTVPEATLIAFLEHGSVSQTLDQDFPEAEETIESVERAGISMALVTDTLLTDGVKSFADSYDELLSNINDKTSQLRTREHRHPGVSIGDLLPDVENALVDFQESDVVARIWRRDHTVWDPDPRELTDRLGWLTITDAISGRLPELEQFAEQAKEAGFRNVVLLGMGGSSLGPEVLRQTFGSAPGYPDLIVLDSTVPAWVQAVTDRIDPAKTLFVVSSKSGGTIEPNSLYAHFRGLVEQSVGSDAAGNHFVAITDPGTALEELGKKAGFRAVFLNPPDIGGRYSVLSYFGLVPAALSGIDLSTLLDRANRMKEGCASTVPAHENPGARLGTVMGAAALRGRDKVTIVTSPSIKSFGLWAEQLIAESLGKQGKGLVPVAGEPLLDPNMYGDDRLFVFLRAESDVNTATDAAIDRLRAAGQPVVRLDLKDKYDLGAEFFRWEFATAVAGAIIGVHPFDQPNVQAAKDMTESVLREFETSGVLPEAPPTLSAEELTSSLKPGGYVAIMAYIQQTPEVDSALYALRRNLAERHRIATTLGLGPRFLHSTGQLHKGGPDTALFIQLTEEHAEDVPIPGRPYSFGTLADAQALGDLKALQASDRPVARVQLGSDPVSSILRLAQELA